MAGDLLAVIAVQPVNRGQYQRKKSRVYPIDTSAKTQQLQPESQARSAHAKSDGAVYCESLVCCTFLPSIVSQLSRQHGRLPV